MGIGNIANTGMKAAMTNMEIISNNISNANTVGFKKSFANFSDVMASGSGTQTGLGVNIQSVKQDFKAGNSESTKIRSDLSIKSDGFFTLKDSGTGQVSYTRAGRFDVDSDGYIVRDNQRLQGFPASNGVILAGSTAEDLHISSAPMAAKATAAVKENINLDSSSVIPTGTFSDSDPTTYNYRTDANLYDSLGNSYPLSLFYIKTANNNWTVNAQVNGASVGSGAMVFDTSGGLTSTTGLGSLSWSPTSGATAPQVFSISMNNSTQYGGGNQTREITQDGYQAGIPNDYNIDKSGKVTISYSNNQKITSGQIAIARFPSVDGLQSIGNMSWIETGDSGAANLSQVNSSGNITSGSLELSNVDLTEEMVNLLSAQHSFQANAQVQQTYSEVMQTVIKL